MSLIVSLTGDIATCHQLRRKVFIEEQAVPEAEEVDGKDGEALHFLAEKDGIPIGCARILLKADAGKIGRVCVLADGRGAGVGAALIKACVDHLRTLESAKKAVLGSQCHAIPFYEGLGFTAFGPVYDDAGIDHRDMELML
ncbi:GNAT family N-acetyltransferase [Halocynthiibacter sp.]|uniref:GNAT family N-acetyltransferase n=1 Tax=Halocynthiibacter sp. TaxID=1979210 RepID=UPI003C4BE055